MRPDEIRTGQLAELLGVSRQTVSARVRKVGCPSRYGRIARADLVRFFPHAIELISRINTDGGQGVN